MLTPYELEDPQVAAHHDRSYNLFAPGGGFIKIARGGPTPFSEMGFRDGIHCRTVLRRLIDQGYTIYVKYNGNLFSLYNLRGNTFKSRERSTGLDFYTPLSEYTLMGWKRP